MRAVHLPGVEIRVADWLSRWDIDPKYPDNFFKYIGEDVHAELEVTQDMFQFSGKI